PPVRRFRVLIQKAHELAAEIKGLGSSLLAALEKRDAEGLAQIRARQERDVVEIVRTTRKLQIEEAKASLTGLEENFKAAQTRLDFYTNAPFTIPEEADQAAHVASAGSYQVSSQGVAAEASALAGVPQVIADTECSGTEFGGLQLHNI